MTLLAYFIGSLALAAGTGLVIVALLHMESRERMGYVSKGWRYKHQNLSEIGTGGHNRPRRLR